MPVIDFNQPLGLHPILLLTLVAWALFWKGLALWRAGHNNQRGWFIFFLIVNTLGILEIVYLKFFAKKKK